MENGYLWSQCHFFEQRSFAGMAAQLVDAARGGRSGFARVRRAVTVANEAYGIEAGRNVSLLIVYPHFDVKGVCSYTLKSGRCPKKYRGFPTSRRRRASSTTLRRRRARATTQRGGPRRDTTRVSHTRYRPLPLNPSPGLMI